MLAETADPHAISEAGHKSRFFRQSGWMMVSAVGGGVLMSFVHVYSKFMEGEQYETMAALLQVLGWIALPAIGLQTTFAQQTSAAVTEQQRRQLYGTVRSVMLGTFVIWILMVAAAAACRRQLTSSLHITDPWSLWLMLTSGLLMLWSPIWLGVLQGRQNFLWLGWSQVLNAVGRLGAAGLFMWLVSRTVGGIMAGVLAGSAMLLVIGLWQNRDIWSEPRDRFEAGPWLRRVVPLSFGCATSQILLGADAIIVRSHFNDAPAYMFGGTLARAVVLFTAPLVAVMFPKIVHSAARRQKSNLMGLTLLVTLVLCVVAVGGLAVTAPFMIRLLSKREYVSIVPLMPLFGLSMAPLAVGNVLLNNLMAHCRFKCVPVLVAVAVGYWLTLTWFHDSFRQVVEILGIFNLLYLAVCAIFTWGIRDQPMLEPVETLLPGEKV
jgi:O-antigen/teichoic acid export membrane protein